MLLKLLILPNVKRLAISGVCPKMTANEKGLAGRWGIGSTTDAMKNERCRDALKMII